MYKNIFQYDEMKRAEHMAVRNAVGWYFWTHQLVEVTGPDAAPFLDHLYTGNIASLQVGRDRTTPLALFVEGAPTSNIMLSNVARRFARVGEDLRREALDVLLAALGESRFAKPEDAALARRIRKAALALG